jgi:hypothetical protein
MSAEVTASLRGSVRQHRTTNLRPTNHPRRSTMTDMDRSRKQALTCMFVASQSLQTRSRSTRRVIGSSPIGGAKLLVSAMMALDSGS